jgi:acetyltransferase-like isoleucine patch superfamily enzyme
MMALLLKIVRGSKSRLRKIWFLILGINLKGPIWMGIVSIPRNWSDISLYSCSLDDGVILLCTGASKRGKITIEQGAYINRYTMIDAHESIIISKECMIGPHCYITDGDHGMEMDIPVGKQPMTTAPVLLEEGVWLGAGVKVLKGVTIGRHAVVGAGAVVTKSIPPGGIAVGVPSRVIGFKKLEK